jgi:Domain of unknown function (DUF4211)
MPFILENYFRIAMWKMQGGTIRDSLVKSQAWQPEIAHALQTYPNLEMTALEYRLEGCEACHLARVSNQRATLSGKPYDQLGFEVGRALSEKFQKTNEWNSETLVCQMRFIGFPSCL